MFWYEEFWIITLIVLLIVYIFVKSKRLVPTLTALFIWGMRAAVLLNMPFISTMGTRASLAPNSPAPSFDLKQGRLEYLQRYDVDL